MAITKLGGGILGGAIGGMSAGRLSEEERKAIRKHYRLSEDSSLVARNVGRGFVGGALGSLGGQLLTLGRPVGGLIGAGAGGYLFSRKYSKGSPALDYMEEE